MFDTLRVPLVYTYVCIYISAHLPTQKFISLCFGCSTHTHTYDMYTWINTYICIYVYALTYTEDTHIYIYTYDVSVYITYDVSVYMLEYLCVYVRIHNTHLDVYMSVHYIVYI